MARTCGVGFRISGFRCRGSGSGFRVGGQAVRGLGFGAQGALAFGVPQLIDSSCIDVGGNGFWFSGQWASQDLGAQPLSRKTSPSMCRSMLGTFAVSGRRFKNCGDMGLYFHSHVAVYRKFRSRYSTLHRDCQASVLNCTHKASTLNPKP